MNDKLIFWLSFFIPGSGHLILKQYKKAILGFIFTALAWISTITALIPTLRMVFINQSDGEYAGKLTIGSIPYEDDSFLILVGAVFALACIIAFILVSYMIARNARSIKVAIDNGDEVISFKEKMRVVAPDIIPHAVTGPGFILMFLFMIVPAIISILIAFTNYKSPVLPPAFLIEWRGLDNFKKLFTDPRLSAAFTETITWTLVWTFCATILVITLGIFLAVLCNSKKVKAKKFFRTIYLLPWAVPAFLTILIFQIFFSRIGTMNTIVVPFFTGKEYDISNAIPFLMNPNYAKLVIILIQGWLGFPYIYVLTTGILQTIPDDLYEAANIDGGNAWSNFWDITFPIIMISAAPTMITQFTFNFNNVTIIYLLTGSVVKDVGSMYGPLETIASLGYKLTMDAEYSTAALFTLITSVIVSSVVLWSWIKTGAFSKEDVM